MAKILLMALNGGRDEIRAATSWGRRCPSWARVRWIMMKSSRVWTNTWRGSRALYVNTMNVIHYMHDKYAYEKTQMALHDTDVHRFMAFGVAGLSVVTDSLSAIRYAKVKPGRDERTAA